MALNLLPTKLYDDLNCPASIFYNCLNNSDYKLLIIKGYNIKKAKESFNKIVDLIYEKYGLSDDFKNDIIEISNLLILEFDSINNPKKDIYFKRAVQDFEKKNETKLNKHESINLTEIASTIGAFFKTKDVNLNKMSIDEVLQSYLIMNKING